MINKAQWLDHLIHATPIEGYGNRMSTFLISLEAWRRGIDVKFFTIDDPDNKLLIRYALSHNDRTVSFNSSLSLQLPDETYNLCQDKDLTKKQLAKYGIRVPRGEKLEKSVDLNYLSKLATELTYPVVMKPVGENAGKGVFSNITDEPMLFETFDYLTNDLGYDEVILEEFIEGEEHRLLSVGNKVVGVVKRVPANIIGNGKDTIRTLIRQKNKAKRINPVVYNKIIEIDREVENELSKSGYGLSDILEKDKQLFLRNKSNVSAGGDPVDVMDQIDESVIHIGERAAKAIPGIELGGIDMIINPKTKEKVIIEINTKPMIGLHVFPEKGEPRDVVKEIVDFYFPETKDIKRSRLYFDFNRVTRSLDHVTTREIKLQRPPLIDFHAKRFLVSTERGHSQLRREIRRMAVSEGLYGYAKGVKPNTIEVILASPDENKVERFFATHFNQTDYTFDIQEESIWEHPINIGFVTSRYSNNVTLAEKHIREANNHIKQVSRSHEREIDKLSERLEESKKQKKIYQEAFRKLEKQKNKLKKLEKQQLSTIEKQKEEIEWLKAELNRTLLRRIIKSKRV